MNAKLLALTFVLGGTIVTLTTYFGKMGERGKMELMDTKVEVK